MTKVLEAFNLTKSFGGLQATKDVSLHAEEAESVGIIGPNGAGKTTIFNLLTNEIKPDAGSVSLDGVNIDKLPIHERVKIGLVRTYQVPRPFSDLSVIENIRVSMMPDDIWDMLRVRIRKQDEQDIAESVGFNTKQFSQLPSELAIGDLRRLELARSLANNPKVLLLDEVFAGLTYGEIDQISNLLIERRKNYGTTYLIVSHDLKALEPLVDRVIVIHNGKILAEGSFSEVTDNELVQEAYLGVGNGQML